MKKSTTIIGLALTMLAVYAILNLVSLKRDLADAMEQTSALQAEIRQAQTDSAYLEEQMQDIDTDDGIERLAKHRLKLIGSDEKIFRDIRG
jgi:cell division protein FtsB